MAKKTTTKNTGGDQSVTTYNVGFTLVTKAMEAGKSAGVMSAAEDPFEAYYGDEIIRPPYDPAQLAMFLEYDTVLGPCIWAMAENVDGFGHELIPAEWTDEQTTQSTEAIAEYSRLMLFLKYPNSNLTESFIDVRKQLRWDLELGGDLYAEVVTNREGAIAEYYRLPAHTMRITRRDDKPTRFVETVRDESTGEYIEIPRMKRFRRFVQVIAGQKKVYFKEFGDPRVISARTGKVVRGTDEAAHEVIHVKLPCTYSPYGLPRWAGQIVGMLGSRKAEEINFLYFDNKTIPPVVITVSGGTLTKETHARLKDVLDNEIRGADNFWKALILEAKPLTAVLQDDKIGTCRIDIKPLTNFLERDALFAGYRKENANAVRASFRIHPIYVGRSDDYNRAVAVEASRVTEQQVFIPERRKTDFIQNRTLFSRMGAKYWTYRSLGAKTDDDAEIVTALGAIKEALPISMLIEAASELRNTPLPDIPEEYKTMTLNQLQAATNAAIFGIENQDQNAIQKAAQILPRLRGEEFPDVVKGLLEWRQELKETLEAAEVQAIEEAA